MEPGSSIEIAANNTGVLIRNTDIHGCDEMWNGIVINSNAAVFMGDGSTIEDAYAAFTVMEGATLNIDNTTFNRNLAGIASTSEFSLTMTGTTFDCTSALSPPLEGHFSEVGIRVSDGNLLSIGINGTSPNEFRNLNNGILALRNSLLVQNTNFSNIRQQGSDSYPHMGFGIRAESVNAPLAAFTVTQTGNGKNGAPSFTDCTHGIYLRGMAVDVSGNKMTGMNRGITTGFCHTDINIRDNDISCRLSGIEMLQSDLNSTRTIKDNHITLTYKSHGITVDESAVILTEPLDGVIRKNTIDFSPTAAGPGSGIRLTSSIFYNLYDNTVNIDQAVGNVTGILVSGGTFNMLDYNHVFGNNDDANTGIWGHSCPDVLWQCNDVHNTNTGFRYNLPCNTTDKFRGNIMSNHQTGLRMGGGVDINGFGARLGAQTQRGNKWIGTFNSNLGAARHEGSFDDIDGSLFFAQQTSPYWPPSIQTPQAPLANWFTSGNPGPKGAYICSGPEFDEEETDGADEMIAGGDPSLDSTVRWLSEQYLYRKLSRNPSYVANSTALQDFMDDNDETAIGRFYEVETSIGSLFTIDATSLGQILANYELQKEKTDSIQLFDSLLVTATGNDSLNLLAARALLFQQYGDLAQNSKEIIDNVLSQRATNATAIITDNSSITTTQVFEQNEQSFNDIFLNTVAKGDLDFTATQVTDLQDIAYQCPAEGGNAVFKARAMLSVITQEDFDDEEICSGLGEREVKKAESVETKNFFTVFPNPASDLVNIEWEGVAPGSEGQVLLFDLTGREVLRKELSFDVGKTSLTTVQLPSGAYWCKVKVDGVEIFAERIVLIK